MSKLSVNKLNLTKEQESQKKEVVLNNETIEIKQYLPVKEKMELIDDVLRNSIDENGIYNPVKIDVFTSLNIIYYYTNITFTDKQKQDPYKIFDLLESNFIFSTIANSIPEREYNFILSVIEESAKSITNFNNSIMGILSRVSQDYSNVSFDAEKIMNTLADPEQLQLVKDIVTKL